MAKFMVRIELHEISGRDPTAEDYVYLHGYMELDGFIRTIKGDSGTPRKLPQATYFGTSDESVTEIRDLARENAKRVWSGQHTVFVVKSCGWAWGSS